MFNYNFKLLLGGIVIAEQRIAIDPAKLEEAVNFRISTARAEFNVGMPRAPFMPDERPDGPDAHMATVVERGASHIMYEIERAINSQTGIRCHVEELPPDVPAGMQLEEEALNG